MKQHRKRIRQANCIFLLTLSLSVFLSPLTIAQESAPSGWPAVKVEMDKYLSARNPSYTTFVYTRGQVHRRLKDYIKNHGNLSKKQQADLDLKYYPIELFMNRVTAMGGEHVYIAIINMPYTDYRHCLVFDKNGTLLGRPFRLAVLHNHQRTRTVYKNKVEGDTFDIEFAFEYKVDDQGIVPLGFVLKHYEKPAISFPINMNSSGLADDWKDSIPAKPYHSTETLLASNKTGDIFRGLFNLEFEKPEKLELAISFLKHDNPNIRARAAAVLSNDPVACNAVLSLRDDPDPRVRRAAHLAAVHCSNVEESIVSFKYLLEDMPYLFLSKTVFDFKRLRSNDMARLLLQKLIDSFKADRDDYLSDEILERIDMFRKEDLAGLGPLLLQAWRHPHDSRAILQCLVRIEEPKIDALLVQYLKDRSIENAVPFEHLLMSLAKRPAILSDAVTPLISLATIDKPIKHHKYSFCNLDASSARGLATLILVRWEVPGMFRALLNRLSAGKSLLIPYEIYDEHDDRWHGEAWCQAMNLSQKRSLIRLACKQPQILGPEVVNILKWDQAPNTLANYADLLALWRAMIPEDEAFEDLSKLLIVQDASDVEAFLQEALKHPNSIRTASLLMQLLMERQERPIQSVVPLIKRLAAQPAYLPETVLYHRDDEKEQAEDDGYRCDDYYYNRHQYHLTCAEVDIQLAALLLLIHWRIDDAETRFFEDLKEGHSDWLFDALLETVPPRHIVKKLVACRRWLFESLQKKNNETGKTPKISPSLPHPPPDIRAQAIAGLVDHPDKQNHIIPFCDDPSEQVRHEAYAALLRSKDRTLVKRSFLYFLKRGEGSFLRHVHCDAKRQLVKESARFIFHEIIEQWKYYDGHAQDLVALIEPLEREDLVPHQEDILYLWENNADLKENGALAEVWLRFILRCDAPQTSALISRWLIKQKAVNNVPFGTFLLILAEHNSPILTAIPLLKDITKEKDSAVFYIKQLNVYTSLRQLAMLVLLRWKADNVLDRFVEIMELEMDPEALKIKGWGKLWGQALTTEQKKFLIKIELKGKHYIVDPLTRILFWCKNRETGQLRHECLELWQHMQPWGESYNTLTELLVRQENPAIDKVVLSCLKKSLNEQAAIILFHLLRCRRDKPIPEAIDNLVKRAARRTDIYPVHMFRKDRINAIDEDDIEIPTPSLSSTDIQLAAALLLVHWKVPDAEKHLFRVLYQEGGDCLFDHLWDMAPPRHISAALEAVTKEYPDIYKKRLTQIMEPG